VYRSYLRSLRAFSRDVRLLLGVSALFGFSASGGIYGVLLGLYLLRLGYGPAFIGLVSAVGTLSTVLFCLPAGALAERWGYRRTILIGVLLQAGGYALLPVGEFVPPAIRDGWILAACLANGLGTALYMVNITPVLTDATTPRERSHVFSLRVAVIPLSGFAGSLIGGLLPTAYGLALGLPAEHPAAYRWSLWTACLALCLAVPAVLATSERRVGSGREAEGAQACRPRVRGRSLAPVGVVLLLSTVGFLRVSGEGAPGAFFTLYLDTQLGMSTPQIGTLMAVGRLLAIPAALVSPLLIARWGSGRVIVAGALGVTLGLLPVGLIAHWAAAGLGYMAMTALAAVSRSAFIVHCQEAVPPRWRVTISAATTMSARMSWSMIAFGGGYLIGAVGYQGLFLTGAALTGVGALLFWHQFLGRRETGPDVAPTG